jgi:macrodomain Ter protein organizer (MatP/YcbG family)
MGRKRVFTDEERKERKKAYDLKYQNNRYRTDAVYRDMKKGISNNHYAKKIKPVEPAKI